jgi:hypothetical protein
MNLLVLLVLTLVLAGIVAAAGFVVMAVVSSRTRN